MRGILRIFDLGQYSFWTKFAVGFLIVALFSTTITFLGIAAGIRQADEDNLREFIADRGQQRQEDVIQAFDRMRLELSSFIRNPAYNVHLLRLLFYDNAASFTIEELEAYLDQQLVGGGLFSQARILSTEGEVLISSGRLTPEGREASVPVGIDQSGTQAFQAGLTAAALGDEQRMTISGEGEVLTIEIVQVIYRNENPMGYVVGMVNNQTALIPALSRGTALTPTNSYLAADGGRIITPLPDRLQSLASQQVAPVSQGIAGRSGIAAYVVNNREMVGYYAPITGTPFAIITEGGREGAFAFTLQSLYVRGVILLIITGVVALIMATIAHQSLVPALRSLQSQMRTLFEGDFDSPVPVADRKDDIGGLGRAFVDMRNQFEDLINDLQNDVIERMLDLQATEEVSRFAASQRDLPVLMDQVVQLVTNQFANIYHAQIFLADSDRRYAVLRASTGEAGRQLLARGHRLEIGGVSVVGQSTEEGRVVIARDTAASPIHRQNELLPDTRAELAIPLRLGDETIGVLDVQSTQSDSFTEDQTRILQIMADQIAIAIQNARLYQESVQRLEELQVANQQGTLRAWKDHMNYLREQALTIQAGAPEAFELDTLREQAEQTGMPIVGDITEANTVPVAVPITLRGQVLGSVEWELRAADFSAEKVRLAEELVNRLAISLDNARLFQASRSAIERERLVNEISARLTGQTDIDEILQTAVREVGQALRAPQVNLQLRWMEKNANGANGSDGGANGQNGTHGSANGTSNDHDDPAR